MKHILSILICLSAMNAFSQQKKNSKIIHAKFSFGKDDFTYYQNYSIGAEYFLTKQLGLNYNIDFVHRTDNINQLHSSIGMLAGPPLIGVGALLMLADKNDPDKERMRGFLTFVGGILILVMPEGATYHFPVNKNWDFAPYANVLGVDIMKKTTTKSWLISGHLRYSATFGFKVNHWNSNGINVFGFVETRKTAAMDWTAGGGLGVGRTLR